MPPAAIASSVPRRHGERVRVARWPRGGGGRARSGWVAGTWARDRSRPTRRRSRGRGAPTTAASSRSKRHDRRCRVTDQLVGQASPGASTAADSSSACCSTASAARPPGVGERVEHPSEPRVAAPVGAGEVGAGEERPAVGGAEHRHRPAARAVLGLHRRHVDRVEVGPLLPVDLDRDEPRRRGGRPPRGPRRTRGPSRGTSGRRRSRSRRRAACPRRPPAPSASSPQGYQSTGLSACWRR